MVKKGRPFGSKIRQNIVEVLYFLGKGYGYEIHKLYCELFNKCTREVVYYNLKKGVSMGEFKVEEIRIEKGNFSWGPEVRKIVYALGDQAKPQGMPEIKSAVDKFKEEQNKAHPSQSVPAQPVVKPQTTNIPKSSGKAQPKDLSNQSKPNKDSKVAGAK